MLNVKQVCAAVQEIQTMDAQGDEMTQLFESILHADVLAAIADNAAEDPAGCAAAALRTRAHKRRLDRGELDLAPLHRVVDVFKLRKIDEGKSLMWAALYAGHKILATRVDEEGCGAAMCAVRLAGAHPIGGN